MLRTSKRLEGIKFHIEQSLLSSSLGISISAELQQLNAEVNETDHPMEYIIT
jgi:hypothetical protein